MPARTAAILVVDDNPPTRYSTSRVLRNEGFAVLEAGTGQEALQLATAESLDLIVLDVNLPDMDGFEVCRRLRASGLHSRTPVIHLSATLNRTRPSSSWAETRISPRGVNFSAFEMKLRRICDSFLSSV